MNPLSWDVEATEGATVVTFSGELDMAGFDDAERALLTAEETGSPLLVLDLSGLGFVDSNGLHFLLLARERADTGSHRLAVVPGKVRKLLELSGMLGLFDLLDEAPGPSRDQDPRLEPLL